jgi:sugar lactone lactonase YvrE
MSRVERVLCIGNIVGESAVWCVRTRRLLWVDIGGRSVHALTPATALHQQWTMPDIVTSIGLREDGGAVLGLSKQVVRWDFGTDFTPLATIEPELPDNRLNEGRVGPDGAFWVGTMQNNLDSHGGPIPITRSSGAYHRVWADGRVDTLSSAEYGICNTMIWNDAGQFLSADTLANRIYTFDFLDGTLSNRTPFGQPLDRGLPDGSAIDEQGYLWNCRVTGGCIARFAPDGTLDRVVDLPCSSPTSCQFGGDHLRTLFVTSARFGLPRGRADHPDEGALFAMDVGVAGLPEHRFG